jgi:hypothetical protein
VEEASHFVLLRNDLGSLAAAAVAKEGRLTSLSTTPTSGGGRTALGLEVLAACHDERIVSWLSIGLEHHKVVGLVKQAGMEMVQDPTEIAAFLKLGLPTSLSAATKLVIPQYFEGRKQLNDGPIVINGPASSRPGYPQTVWAWSDREQ